MKTSPCFSNLLDTRTAYALLEEKYTKAATQIKPLQKFLCKLPQHTWKTADEKDIFVILCEYALTSLEGGNLSLTFIESSRD